MGVSIIFAPQYPLAEVALSLLPAPLGLGLLAPLGLGLHPAALGLGLLH